MPNHVINIINFSGDQKKIAEMLESIKSDEIGIGSIDFQKIIPMPESLNIESGSRTTKGLKAYKDFVDICTFDGANKDMDLLNIPQDKEKIFLRMRKDIKEDEWELGRQAFRNEVMYGEATWYDWAIKNWGTKWNAYGIDEQALPSDENITSLAFNTAWSAPHPIIEKIAEMYPELSFEHIWADEDIGMNCGERAYENGECTSVYYPGGEQAVIFANNAWGYDDINEGMGEQNI